MEPTPADRTFRFSRDVIATRDEWSIEASAGTGKTWTIENFVAHYLASGSIHPDDVVVVTFTRLAASELRSRIRKNIATIAAASSDYSAKERQNLRNALADFGQLRISTIHGFAQRCLSLLGDPLGEVTSDVDTDQFRASTLSDVLRSLPAESARQFSDRTERNRLEEILRALAANPSAQLFASSPSPDIEEMISVVERAYDALVARKNALGIAGFDDLLLRLNRRLDDPDDARTVAAGIKVLLIDEFQDTDGLQWEIFKKIRAATTLTSFVVVGDPKQAIYGFRGGDVQVYREAVAEESAHLLIGNRRSTTNFVEAGNRYFSATTFGINFPFSELDPDWTLRDVDIPFVPVTANGALRDVPSGPSWIFRHVVGTLAEEIRENVAHDLPSYIRAVVGRETIPDVDVPQPDQAPARPLRFDDVCILTTSNQYAARLLRQLQRHAIPATVIGGANVFSSPAATQWRYLLSALQAPASGESARLLAISWFGGTSLRDVATLRDDEAWLAARQQLLLRWRDLFSTESRHDFFDVVMEESGVLSFLVGTPSAERHITDVQHIAELLRTRNRDTLVQLNEFLNDASRNDDGDATSDVDVVGGQWSRRVDSDDQAVRVMTVHKSKGLQFPVVLIPYASSYAINTSKAVAYRAYRNDVGTTVLDVTASDKTPGARVKSSIAAAENLRRAYVALTRAQVRNVLWTWDDPSRATSRPVIRSNAERMHLAEEHPEFFVYHHATPISPAIEVASDNAPRRLRELATMSRTLAAPRGRHSFSSLSNHISGSPVPRSTARDVEPTDVDGNVDEVFDIDDASFITLRSSAQIGRVVHRVLQYADVSADDRRTALARELTDAAAAEGLLLDRGGPRDVSSASLLSLIEQSVDTPLGELADGRTLGLFPPKCRLPEMGFEFVIPDGVGVQWRGVRQLLQRHLDPIADYHNWLAELDFDTLEVRGVLTGSLDAVLGWERRGHPVFLVVDYKTNLVTGPDGIERYDDGTLWSTMSEHHYQLQAIMYLVALHRYLRTRVPDYDYDRHVAGAAYLFLRGMSPSKPGSGVVALRPPAALINDLSDLFDGTYRD